MSANLWLVLLTVAFGLLLIVWVLWSGAKRFLQDHQFYREWRGGYWVYTHFNGWQHVSELQYENKFKERLGRPLWSFESY